MHFSFRLSLLGACVVVAPLFSQSNSTSEDVKKKAIADANRRMSEVISTTSFQDKLPFATFLKKLNQQVSKEAKFTIRLDRDAFGKDANKILSQEVSLPPVPAKMNALLALRLALAQAASDKYQIEFSPYPGELVITTRDRSLYTMTYEIGDLLKHTRQLRQMAVDDAKRFEGQEREFGAGGLFANFDLKADLTKPDEWLVRQLMAVSPDEHAGWHKRIPTSTIRINNGSKIVVHAPPRIHDEVRMTLDIMRRLLDLAVVMTARLYELDRAEYDTHFAASFADPKNKSATKLVSTVSEAQWKRLQTMKPILNGGDAKLAPNERGEFLSVQNAYQYQAKPGDAAPTTAFEGLSFSVRPIVSSDRRCLRLELSQDVAQLVKITKGTMVDLKTGKDAPIELPNVRKSSASQTIEIHDGQPILLAVDYRPKDKVWLVLAEPRIYMEEEEEQIRKSAIKRMPLADEKPAPPEPEEPPVEAEKAPAKPPAVQLPDNDEVKQILTDVIKSVLTDPKIDVHDFYGTKGDQKFALSNSGTVLWPKTFRANIVGFTQVQPLESGPCRFGFHQRLMGIRLDGFDWDGKKAEVREFSIDIAISNVGGGANGAVIGGCFVNFTATREGKRWRVEWNSLLDP